MKHTHIKPKWGGYLTLLPRVLLMLLLWVPLPASIWAATQLLALAKEVPEVPMLEGLEPTWPSRIETLDGERLAGAKAQEHLPVEQMPTLLVGALLAAEDEDFFVHRAFNLRSIARAAMQNFRAGRSSQGGSTLTQQLAKQFMGREKSYQRKLRELLLARRFEATYSKSQLLKAYLSYAFWGHRNHGVTQASWFYFDRDPRDLTLGQMATLTGMLPAPNRFDPMRHPARAKKRRDYVLGRMVATGMITPLEMELARAAPLNTRVPKVHRPTLPSAYYTGLRTLGALGEDAWSDGGYEVVMPHDRLAQIDARNALTEAIEAYDRRQGWRGARGVVAPEHQDEALRLLQGSQVEGWGLQLGVVEDLGAQVMQVRLPDRTLATVRLEHHRWASSASIPRHYKRPVRLNSFRHSFSQGELVVLWRDPEGVWRLVQKPVMEGALFVQEVSTGRLLASVGAYEPGASDFNRAEQGCRQPGSVFKPFVYAEALKTGFGPATMLADVPKEFISERGEIWQPRNADRNFKGYITMSRALAASRNIPTVYLSERVGARFVKQRAKRFGLTTAMKAVPSLALGASCVKPFELVSAYSAIERQGRVLKPQFVDRVRRGQGGAYLEHRGRWSAPYLEVGMRLERLARGPEKMPRAVSSAIAFVLKWMLRQVVVAGTAYKIPNTWPVMGKTGTTNAYDTWFLGFDKERAAGVWIGSDLNQDKVGRGEHGATVAMPAFQAFYAPRASVAPPLDWSSPPKSVTFMRVDPPTGLLAQDGEPGVMYPFIPGTEPLEFAPTQGTKQSEEVDELMHQF